MPRNPDSPRASEVHWLSAEEKESTLAQLGGESFSNYVRQQLFNLPSLQHGGARQQPEEAMIPESILQMCEAKGGQLKALVRNYRAAKARMHRQKIAETLQSNFTPAIWVAYYKATGQK